MLRRASATPDRLAETFGTFEVLGNQPFAPLAADARQVAAQLRGIAGDMDRLGIRLGSMGRQVPPLATDVSTTAMELHALAAELAGLSISESAATALAWLVVGVVLLVAWLLVPALAALQVGTWLLRSPPAVTPA